MFNDNAYRVAYEDLIMSLLDINSQEVEHLMKALNNGLLFLKDKSLDDVVYYKTEVHDNDRLQFYVIIESLFELVRFEYFLKIKSYIMDKLKNNNKIEFNKELEEKIKSWLGMKIYSNIKLEADIIGFYVDNEEDLNQLLFSNNVMDKDEIDEIMDKAVKEYLEMFLENVLGISYNEFINHSFNYRK